MIQHVIRIRHLALLVANDGEPQVRSANLVDVFDPSGVAVDGVCGQANELNTALCEFGLELGEGAEFGGADWGVVFGMGEEDDPVVTDEFVEVDGTAGGVGLEVGGDGAKAEAVDMSVALLIFAR